MAGNAHCLASIEATLKKIDDLIVEYHDLSDRVTKFVRKLTSQVNNAESWDQKEKYESELKKQIKKLQKQRDILKQWQQKMDSSIAVRFADFD